MTNLLAYSGLTTKVRAMEGNLLSEQDFSQIMSLSSVTEVISFLEKQKGYKNFLGNSNIYDIHRGDLEKHLMVSAYRDYAKLYNFASVSQRKYLELYFMKYETHLLKQILREILNTGHIEYDLSIIKPYLDKFSKINVSLLSGTTTLEEFTEALKDTVYYKPLMALHSASNTLLFDYELCLDLQYFETMWKGRDKYLSGTDYKVITASYGMMIDLLNIQWIYRCKKYYSMSGPQVVAMLIPVNYKLKKQQLREMANADSLESMLNIFGKTYYSKMIRSLSLDINRQDLLYKLLMDKQHNASFKTNPYSIACIDTYLYKKQQEISKLIYLIECIRYSYPPDKINTIMNNGGEPT